jgi:alkylation response protein AidB-like acyl-CoA dehydrogenase
MTGHEIPGDVLTVADTIAEQVLFPAAQAVDESGTIPPGHFDLLADQGFYGLAAPEALGGLGLGFPAACAVVETLAAGCLCTTFVWLQHHGLVLQLAYGKSHRLRDEWLPQLVSGRRRAGVALAGTLPGPPVLVAEPAADGYVLTGNAPWVTGWGMVDVLAVAARDGDNLVWVLVDAKESDTLKIDPLRMVAVSASNTVVAEFTGHPVPADRVISTQPYAEWARGDAGGLRMNGSLSLGLTRRCLSLLGPSPLDAEFAAARDRLDTAEGDDLFVARAQASALAQRAATALVAGTGSQAVLLGRDAQRLAREAMFLLVFGSRPGIKQALLPMLTGARGDSSAIPRSLT